MIDNSEVISHTSLTKSGANMVVDWERLAKKAGRLFLLLLEYCIKLSALVVTAVVLAADGSLGMKLGTGFGSLSPALRSLFEAPGEIAGAANIIHRYNTLPAETFNGQYGADALNSVLTYLDGGIIYLQTVNQNFANRPFGTFFAVLIAFCSLYLVSLILRFARQKGQGSWFNKLERKLAARVFATSDKPSKPVPDGQPEPKSEPEKKARKSFGNNPTVNKHLQDYMRSVQNG